METNPFLYGVPVSPEHFFDRKRYVRRIRNRLVKGQSSALVGEPRMGKTSLLEYLADPGQAGVLYRDLASRFVFNRVDAQIFGADLDHGGFWRYATAPLGPVVSDCAAADPELQAAYRRCEEQAFSALLLPELFTRLKASGWSLVLMLDEVDLLLHHPTLATSELFGGLRSLASDTRSGLSVVMASRQPITQLNQLTQEMNPTGSPYFNVFAEMPLGGFSEDDAIDVLCQAESLLDDADRRYVLAVAGGHPYLLQATASAMCDARDDGIEEPFERHLAAGRQIYSEHQAHFADTWRVWSPFTRRAVTMIALAQASEIVPARKFEIEGLLSDLRDLVPELHALETKSVIEEDPTAAGGYRLAQGAMFWWLADELVRTVRSERSFEDWLRDQEMVGLLTRKEVDNFKSAASFVVDVLRDGAKTLIEAYARRVAGI